MTERDFDSRRLELSCYIEELPTRMPGVIKLAFFPEAKLDPIESGKLTLKQLVKRTWGKTNRFKHPRPEDALLIAFYFTGSASQRKQTANVRRRSNGATTTRHPADRYIQVWHEAAEKLMRKLYPSSLSPLCSRLENAASTFQEKLLIKVAAYCADCMHRRDCVMPESKIWASKLRLGTFQITWYETFELLRSRLPQRRPVVRDWQIVLIEGWISKGYYKMDRRELAAAVNPLLERQLKPDTLWKYATVRLGLDSARTSGPKSRKV
jgi:hypothetical protein